MPENVCVSMRAYKDAMLACALASLLGEHVCASAPPLNQCILAGLSGRAEAAQAFQARMAPSAQEKAAAQRLEARSLLLAGRAGLCCNPRCRRCSHSSALPLCGSVLCRLPAPHAVRDMGSLKGKGKRPTVLSLPDYPPQRVMAEPL